MATRSHWRWLTTSEWDEIAAASPAATYFHRRAWSEAIAASDPRWDPRGLGVELPDGQWALIPLVARRGLLRRGLAGRAASTHPGTYGGPITAGRTLTRDDWQSIVETLAHGPLGRLDCFDNVRDPIPTDLVECVLGSRQTHVIALAELPEDPKTSFRKDRKQSINKARRSELRCVAAASEGDVAAYYEVYVDSLRRWGKPLEKAYPLSLFVDMLRRPDAEIWNVVTPEGQVTAGGLFLFTGRHCVWWHGAMLEELEHLGGPSLLIYELVKSARERGCDTFDFNPSGGHKGVLDFKHSFRAQERPLTAWAVHHSLRRPFVRSSARGHGRKGA